MPAADAYPFRRLLVALIEHDPRKRNPRRLAIDANIIGQDFAGFKKLNTALVKNWVRSTGSSTPRDWRQLAALLQAFDVDENLADIMFRVTTRGWDLETLQEQTAPGLADLLKFRQPILSFRQPTFNPTQARPVEIVTAAPAGSDGLSDSLELAHFDTEMEPFQPAVLDVIVEYIQTDYQTRPALLNKPPAKRWEQVRRPVLSAAAAITLIAVSSVVWFQTRPGTERDETQTANTPDGTKTAPDSEPAAPVQELVSCEIDLETIPADNIFQNEFLTEPGCGQVAWRLQYRKTGTDDLNPWIEALDACWAGDVHRLWLRANPETPDNASGWIELQPQQHFNEKQPTSQIDLHAEPDETSEIVGTYPPTKLTKRVDRIRLTLRAEYDAENKIPGSDEYHLGGCWKGQPREGGNGVHFYYTE